MINQYHIQKNIQLYVKRKTLKTLDLSVNKIRNILIIKQLNIVQNIKMRKIKKIK